MSPPARSMLAFLDESQSNQSLDPDTYLLAAGVCDHQSAELVRPIMSGLRLKGQVKLHWHDESEARRRRISDVIAEIPVQHVVVVRTGFAEDRPERQRRHCLERMLYELDQLQVSEATFESRGPKPDLNDRSMLDALRSRQVVSPTLRMAHAPGPTDSLLWIPDAVCGAVTQDRMGNNTYMKIMDSRIDIRIITVPT